MTTIFLGSLPYAFEEADVFALVERVVKVTPLQVRMRARLPGKCFVDLGDSDGPRAITALHDLPVEGRKLRAEMARPRPSR